MQDTFSSEEQFNVCEDDADDQAPAAPTANHKNIHVISCSGRIGINIKHWCC